MLLTLFALDRLGKYLTTRGPSGTAWQTLETGPRMGSNEGMLAGNPGWAGAWQTLEQFNQDGDTLSIHFVPLEQFVHYMDRAGSCSCGPQVIVYDMYGQGQHVPHVSHQPLDARFYGDPDDPGLTAVPGAGPPDDSEDGL